MSENVYSFIFVVFKWNSIDKTSSCKLKVESLMCFFAYLVGSKEVLGHFWYLSSS